MATPSCNVKKPQDSGHLLFPAKPPGLCRFLVGKPRFLSFFPSILSQLISSHPLASLSTSWKMLGASRQGPDEGRAGPTEADTPVIHFSQGPPLLSVVSPSYHPPKASQSCLLTRGFQSQAPVRGWLSAGVNLFQR